MADFTGFYLDGIHSSTYGILRVSDGDRYTEGLIPEFEDYSIELTGGNGDLYGGRRYKPTKFTINIAFDHMTEKQLRGLRQWLGGEELKEFRFDERPYKAYWVKVASKPELEYVCFMEDADDNFIEKERIYKGEGELEFIAYDPFGYCVDKSEIQIGGTKLEKVNGKNWQELRTYKPFSILDDNVIEWAETSGLKNSVEGYNIFDGGIARLYNPGDFPVDFKLYLDDLGDVEKPIHISLYSNKTYSNLIGYMCFTRTQSTENGSHYLVNNKNHSLIWWNGNKYNSEYHRINTDSQWFKIPIGESYLKVEIGDSGVPAQDSCFIQYNYKYY